MCKQIDQALTLERGLQRYETGIERTLGLIQARAQIAHALARFVVTEKTGLRRARSEQAQRESAAQTEPVQCAHYSPG